MIRSRMLALLVASMVVHGIVAAPTMAALGGNADAAANCAGDGYRDYVDAAGDPFKHPGQCMKYVIDGGELLAKNPVFTAVFVDTGEPGGEFEVTLTGAGLLPGASVWVTFLERDGEPGRSETSRIVASDGTLVATIGLQPCGVYEYLRYDTLDRYGNVIEATAPLPC